ncbi:M23 family metallopeptidase [Fictibacillus barbaricus]|uniref:Stage II sporulation protein Q n=1 Tax=Fictibacillus barbaricus TaxID=182136 RepID=A0ABU1U270_9BACL|nr:M23 family metallopeptidase [Fictibacillus barbaricus]MDR7073491.1 stage II sporulation protein Q [Fictibacillus barbaricus]
MKEEEKQTKKPVPMKGMKKMKKRWVYPAVYLSFAAVILTSVLWYQNDAKNEKENTTPKSAFEDNGAAVPVSLTKEKFQMPVADPESVEVVKDFFSSDSTAEEQEAALVFYNNIYYQNRGVDLAAENGKSFDVTAALSGNVVKVAKDPALGWVVEVEHDKGVVTHYSSLASASVKEGDQVKQGTVLGKAGQNAYDKDSKIHAHFEVRKDGEAVDPVMALDQSVAQLATDVDSQRKEMKKQEEKKAEEQKEQKPAEQKKSPEPKADDKGSKDMKKDEGKSGKDGKDANNEKEESSTQSSEDSDAAPSGTKTSADDSGAQD